MKLYALYFTLWYFICISARIFNDLASCIPQRRKIQARVCLIVFVPELLNDGVLQPMLVLSCERSWSRNNISSFNAVRITTNLIERIRGSLVWETMRGRRVWLWSHDKKQRIMWCDKERTLTSFKFCQTAQTSEHIYYIIVLLNIKWPMSHWQQPDVCEVVLTMVSQLQIHRSLLSSSMGTTTNTERSLCSGMNIISESAPLHDRINLRPRRNERYRPTCGRPPVGNPRDLPQAQHLVIRLQGLRLWGLVY